MRYRSLPRAIAAVLAPFVMAASAQGAEHAWYSLLHGIERVGYAHTEREDVPGGTRVRETVVVDVAQLRSRTRLERRVELTRDATGAMRTLAFRTRGGTATVDWRADVVDGRLRFENGTQDTAPAAAPLLLSERALRASPLRAPDAPAQTTATFDLDALAVADVLSERVDATHVRTEIRLGDTRWRDDLTLDATGAFARLDTRVMGVPVSWVPCSADCAARPAAGIDPLDALTLRSPVRIPAAALHRTLRYVIERSDGAAPVLAANAEQATQARGARAVVTVCTDCGAEPAPTAQELQRYLAPNAWVRSDAPAVRNLARASAWPSQSVDKRMRDLVKAVPKRMPGATDMLGYADAVAALNSGSGDCTEFAVLLAALARAQHIPARVVIGLAYASRYAGRRDVFSPHTWVQAWDGVRWRSYDAALEGFDSTHIALYAGDGTPYEMQAAFEQVPLLRMTQAGVVRPR